MSDSRKTPAKAGNKHTAKTKTPLDARTVAAKTLGRVFSRNESLASLLPANLPSVIESERSFYQQLCYGSLRWFYQLNPLLNELMPKPLKSKDSDIQAALIIGLYQLIHARVPDHAAIASTVDISKRLKKPWASKLVNGVLRNFQRERDNLFSQYKDNPCFISAHPKWLVKSIETSWQDLAPAVFDANNQQPPFSLRVNPAYCSSEDYLNKLQLANIDAKQTPFSDVGVTLAQACDVYSLPGFSEGMVSVQDEAAQLAASLLDLQTGQTVLDACCAPGGKTGHLLEREPSLGSITALDLEEKRLVRVHENLQRLGQTQRVEVICGDAAQPEQWWHGEQFDRILLDAPCSATGVIRRHPDIKLLRKPSDIDKLAQLQLQILQAMWALLKPGGRLVYATCSVIPTENTRVIEQFMAAQSDCEEVHLDVDWGIAQTRGRQLLPQNNGHDGFYYAVLTKLNA
jgi:16S rRNA (cytosine967-C5)-methyltransferase